MTPRVACHIIPFAMSRGLEIQAPSSPERDITRLLPSGCLFFISPLCRNKALKSLEGHITDVCFMEASGAKSCTSNAELTLLVKVWFLGNCTTFSVSRGRQTPGCPFFKLYQQRSSRDSRVGWIGLEVQRSYLTSYCME